MATNEFVKDPQTYPVLEGNMLERVLRYGKTREMRDREYLVEQGSPMTESFVVLDGEIAVELTGHRGKEVVTVHGRGEFFGDVHSLSGRPSLVSGRMIGNGRVLSIPRNELQNLMQNDTAIGELLMRAFILRRVELLETSSGDAVIIGSMNSAGTLRLREFLTRNGYPYAFVNLDEEHDLQSVLDEFKVSIEDIPVLLVRGNLLRDPSNEEVANTLGLNSSVDETELRDVAVVGAGPAGLSAAVYAASEGLSAILLETKAPGGQAGSSSRIENYLGFPNGIAGLELASRAYDQAQKFGAEVLITRSAVELSCSRRPLELKTTGGSSLRARTVVIATGAQYRKLPLPNLERFEGVGVYYGASTLEANMCEAKTVMIVGGGNSAGQAAIFLARSAGHVQILIRGDSLDSSMSRYLIRRIEETPNITLHPNTEIVELKGDQHLESVVWRNNRTGETEEHAFRHLYLMTGATPNTAWLRGCVAMDNHGFVLTGADLKTEHLQAAGWDRPRRPYLLETSIPGVFAVGDVRSGSVKRVASGVGEGSLAISFVHQVLGE